MIMTEFELETKEIGQADGQTSDQKSDSQAVWQVVLESGIRPDSPSFSVVAGPLYTVVQTDRQSGCGRLVSHAVIVIDSWKNRQSDIWTVRQLGSLQSPDDSGSVCPAVGQVYFDFFKWYDFYCLRFAIQ